MLLKGIEIHERGGETKQNKRKKKPLKDKFCFKRKKLQHTTK